MALLVGRKSAVTVLGQADKMYVTPLVPSPIPNNLFLYQLTVYAPCKNQLKYLLFQAVFPDFLPIQLITLFTVLPKDLAHATYTVFITSSRTEARVWSNWTQAQSAGLPLPSQAT